MTAGRDVDVLVVGEALIDVIDSGHAVMEHVGGSPANVALGLGRRGDSVALLTQLGHDARGAAVIEHLSASGVRLLAESVSASTTSTAIARIGADSQATYEFDLAWNPVVVQLDQIRPRVVHTGSVGAFKEPGASSVRAILRDTAASEITFDPNIRPVLLGPHARVLADFRETAGLSSIVKMSDEDAAWLYPHLSPTEVLNATLELGPRLVAITLGEDGAIFSSQTHRVRVPAVNVEPVDTIGAGDTFMASLIHSVLRVGSDALSSSTLRQIGTDAVRSAGITVSRAGADLPWHYEL